MDFKNLNPLNVRINTISGNLLPLTPNSRFPISLKIYAIFVWISELIMTIVLIPGCMNVSSEKLLKDGIIYFLVLIEVILVITRIYTRSNLVGQLIQKLNDIVRTDNEIMKNVIIATLKPVMIPLNFYWIAGVASIIVWYGTSLTLVFKKDLFYYEDYRQPSAFSKQPFSAKIFVLGNLFLLLPSIYIFIKKVGVDIYEIHLVLMITAQYRYIALKIAMIFRDENSHTKFDETRQKYCSGKDEWMENELKALCRHHNVIIHLSSMLKKVLSLNCSVIYISSVFHFCCIACMLGTVFKSISLESLLVCVFASGSLVQFFMLCACVQQLLDASTRVTNEAFHEKWYEYSPSVKRIFMLMILGNNLECKLSTCSSFSLSLPSFMKILNQSYSIALLFLKMY